MVSESSLAGRLEFEPPLAIYSPFVDLKVHRRFYFVCLFDSPSMGMELHVREGVKGMIFILNQNPTSLSV